MTPREKAERAEQLLNDPAMKSVFVDIRDDLVSKLEHVGLADTETQKDIVFMLQLLKGFQGKLSKYVQDETVAKHKVEQDRFIEETRKSARAAVRR